MWQYNRQRYRYLGFTKSKCIKKALENLPFYIQRTFFFCFSFLVVLSQGARTSPDIFWEQNGRTFPEVDASKSPLPLGIGNSSLSSRFRFLFGKTHFLIFLNINFFMVFGLSFLKANHDLTTTKNRPWKQTTRVSV